MRAIDRFATLLLLAALLAATAATGIAPALAQNSPTTVTMWLTDTYDDDARTLLQAEFVDTFNAAHPDVVLEISYPEGQEAVRTAVQAGQGPDLIVTPGPAVAAEFASADRILPLDDFAAEYGWRDEILTTYYDAGMFEGQLVSLPLTFEALDTIFYNRTVFEENGWQPPTNRAELEQLCEAATVADLLCFTDGNAGSPYPNQFWFGSLVNRYAGADNVYDALTGAKQWDDPLFVESMQLMKEWMDHGWIGGSVEGFFSASDFDDGYPLLADGEGLMNNQGTWTFSFLPELFEESGQEWDWFLMPPLRDGIEPSFDISVGTTISINAGSANPEAAAEVIDWVFNDKERALRIASGMGFGEWFVPLKWTREELETTGADERFLRYIDEFTALTDAGKIGYTVWTFWPPRSQAYISQELDGMLTGDATPEEFLAGLQAIFAEETAAGQTTTIPPTTVESAD